MMLTYLIISYCDNIYKDKTRYSQAFHKHYIIDFQYMVSKMLLKKCSSSRIRCIYYLCSHKLRHTAATLMYKYRKVDIRSLQQILGHESIATTEIYTHIDVQQQMQSAVNSNPLALMFN